MSDILSGASFQEKLMYLGILVFGIFGLLVVLGSVSGWRSLTIHALNVPFSKMEELDKNWNKIGLKITTKVYSLPKETRFFPGAWFYKDTENRSIKILSRSIENLNYLKTFLRSFKNIESSKESIFRHMRRLMPSGKLYLYSFNNYRKYQAKISWPDLVKKVDELKFEIGEIFEGTDIKIKKTDYKKESSIDSEVHLKTGQLFFTVNVDESSIVRLWFTYGEDYARDLINCRKTVNKNWKKITDSLKKVLENKYVQKEKSGSEITDLMVSEKRFIVISSWGETPEF